MPTKIGLQILLEKKLALVAKKRVGLVSHAAAILPNLTDSVAALKEAGVNLTVLFGPEHGYAGAGADATAIGNSVDTRYGLPIFSLYGDIREPTAEMLQNVDILVVDLQDIGVRFYTYITTLINVLNGAAQHQKPVLVLDRPNPINGLQIEGPLVKAGYESFIGVGGLPVRHGLTIGELAQYMNRDIGAELTVIPLEAWQRAWWFDQTELPWATTSPAMPHLSTITVYAGMCLFEGTNLSEGRGTSLPFEICGAPWLDKYHLAATLNSWQLAGVRFRPIRFMPTAHRFANVECEGVQVYVTDRQRFNAFHVGLAVVKACQAQAPKEFEFLATSWEGQPPHFDLLSGDPRVREGLIREQTVDSLSTQWAMEIKKFQEDRQAALLYAN